MMQPSPFSLPPYSASQICNLLPQQLQHVVTELRLLTQASDGIIINSMLNAMAVAVQASADVFNPLTNTPIPLSLYCITIAESGARKSTVDNILSAPFRDFEQRQSEDEKTHKNDYEHDIEVYNIRLKLLKAKLKKAIVSQHKEDEVNVGAELKSHKETKPILMAAPKILVSDITQPALQKALSAPWRSLCLNTDEAGKILNGKDFSMPSFYNSLWDARPFTVDRISTGRSHVNNYRFSMNLMLQPSIFAKYVRIHGELAKESGFFARCLFAISQPPSMLFQRPRTETISTPHLDRFITRIRTLLASAYQNFSLKGKHEHRLLIVGDCAHILSINEERENYCLRMSINSSNQSLEFIHRATEHILRLAGVMHVFLGEDDSDTIKSDIINDAYSMAKEYSIQYQNAIDFHGVTESLIQALLTFIGANSQYHHALGVFAINKTMLLQKGPSKLRKKENLDMALAILESRRNIQLRRVANATYINLHNDQLTLPSYHPQGHY
ncbi:DUF3987 domain-containing protein [Aeromonas hydrophila]|uniref:DUF3987 domain-containing protein n=1 Tax=Aeromonas hydrophila TaxID=644 RepID=UPI0030D410CE